MNEAVSLFLDGDSKTARVVLRELVNATIGFESLAKELNKPSKSVHRMLSRRGNPTMDNLALIFTILQKSLGCDIEVRPNTHDKRMKLQA